MSLDHYRSIGGRRLGSTRAAFILAVSGILGIVTFTLVYLSTLSYVTS